MRIMPGSERVAAGSSLPWSILITPVLTWRALAGAKFPWPAILAQWLFSALGWLLSARLMAELGLAAGLNTSHAMYSGAGLLAVAILLLPLVTVANLLLAAMIRLWLLLAGFRLQHIQCLNWIAYALLPFMLGAFLGRVLFCFVQPLADNSAQAMALQLRPFTCSLAELWPRSFPPLSLQWFCATYLDLFGLWSLLCLWLGARHYFGLSLARSAWAMGALVLLLLLVLTGLWQATQGLLAP